MDFAFQSNENNKVFQPPFAAARDTSGRRLRIITTWSPLQAGLGQRALPLSSLRPPCPRLQRASRESIRGWSVVL